MEFSSTLRDKEKNTTTFYLLKLRNGIGFGGYTDETLKEDNEYNRVLNSYQRGYFLRKGFSFAIRQANESIIIPEYVDKSGNPVQPKSKDEALDGIYRNTINITGFKYNDGVTDEQKEKAYSEILTSFVGASHNADFNGSGVRHYEFCINDTTKFDNKVIYNNENPENIISVGEIKVKLGILKTCPELFLAKKKGRI